MRYLIFLTLFAAIACTNIPTEPEPTPAAPVEVDSTAFLRQQRFETALANAANEVRSIIESREEGQRYKAMGVELFSSVLLPKMYVENEFKPLWFTHIDSLSRVAQMIEFVAGLEYHGFIPDHYHYAEIRQKLEAYRADKELLFDGFALAQADMMFTDAFFISAAHIYHGKVDQEKLTAEWEIRRDKPNVQFDKILTDMLKSDKSVEEAFRQLYPDLGGYEAMVAEARRLQSLRESDFTVKINPKALSIKPGDSAEYIAAIKDKLAFWSLYTADSTSNANVYDSLAVEGIKKLQKQFGYNTDGAIGELTLKALNMPVEERINQIYVNLERLRWKPDSLEPKFIMVNIADYSLRLQEGRDTLISMRVIVGKNYRKTPVFNSTITYLVLSPTWTVPPTILRNDVLPAVRKNINYLSGKNMQVLNSQGKVVDPATVNWSRDGMKYIIRQAPGPQNALGKVKFMFPNKHNVYLHDTPSRELFARDERAFSSGCIRIEKPFELAKLLLADMPEWTDDRIRDGMNSKSERTVVLKSPVGVYIYYLTAWGMPDGMVNYRSDLYERDAEILKVLREKHEGWN
jgi:murein L,D-transpeptidase YcbB/YkuD